MFVLLALGCLLALGILSWLRTERGARPPVSETTSRAGSEPTSQGEAADDEIARESSSGEPGAQPEAPFTRDEPPERPRQALDDETRTLVGRIVQSAEPLPGIQVELWRQAAPFQYEREQSKTTDASGVFSFYGLEEANHELRMDGPGIPVGYRIQRLLPGTDLIRDLGDLDVPIPSSLTGRLVDEQHNPISGLHVFHTRDPNGSLRFSRSLEETEARRAVTDGEGRFLLESVLPGSHSLLVEDPEYADRTLMNSVEPGQTHDFGDVVVQRGEQLQGRVVGPDGHAVAKAFVVPDGGMLYGEFTRKGVYTDEDGRFRLGGIGRQVQSLAVQVEGFQELRLPKKEWTEPMLVQLQSAMVLAGRVEGLGGRPARITLDTVRGSGRIPTWAYRFIREPFPVAEDGSFHIEGLAEGTYAIRAEAEGFGATEEKVVRVFRGMDPVALTIAPSNEIVVLVRDDRGQPIPGAEVVLDPGIAEYPSLYDGADADLTRRILTNWRRKTKDTTGADGRTVVLQDHRLPIALGAQHPEHVSASVTHKAGAWPDPIEIVLPRAGRIAGTLTDPGGRDQFRISIWIVKAGIDRTKARTGETFSASIDAGGHFDVAQVPPGSYDIAVTRSNATRSDDPATRLLRATPLLGAGMDERTLQRIEAHPGETTSVILDVQPLGRVEGRVFHADRPAPGAIVFAVPPGASSRMRLFSRSAGTPNWDKPDSHEWEPFAITKQDGSFLFLYATPGTWEFRTRHLDSPVPAPPVLVRATGHGRTIQQDLHLGTATIRGQLDMGSLTDERKKSLTAYLFRLERSHTDAFYSPHHGTSESWEMMRLKVGPSGRFEFPYLPEGDWVLRLVSRWDDIILQAPLHTDRNLPIDLGLLKPPKTVEAKVQVVVPEADPASQDPYRWRTLGLWIRKPIAGNEQGMFVRTVRVTQGTAELGALEPGQYQVDLFQGYSGMSIGLSGKSVGEIRTLTVMEDGTVEPASLDYR